MAEVSISELLEGVHLLADVADLRGQLVPACAQAVELAARLDPLDGANRGIEHARQQCPGFGEVANLRSLQEQSDVDAFRDQRAGAIESGGALGLGNPETLVQAPQLPAPLGQLFSSPEVLGTLSAEEVWERVANCLRHPLPVLAVKQDVGVRDLTLPLKAVDERMDERR